MLTIDSRTLRPVAWQHPTAYGSTIGNRPFEESLAAVRERPGAATALRTLRLKGKIITPTRGLPWCSADIRQLCVQGLIRNVKRRIDRTSIYEITSKGRDVLAALGGR